MNVSVVNKMKLEILVCLCTVLIKASGKSVKIIGGKNADIREFPYMIGFKYVRNGKLFCGGTIVSKRNILTAAHCLCDEKSPYNHIDIITGTSFIINNTGIIHKIDRIDFHPLFTSKKTEEEIYIYDVAVVTVTACFNFNKYQNKANLPTNNLMPESTGTIIGWGLTNYPSDNLSRQLKQVAIKIFDKDYCMRRFPFKLHPVQFCAFQGIGVGACKGDSGGPLMVENKVIGIISFTLPCARGVPDVLTRVYSVLDFITLVISHT